MPSRRARFGPALGLHDGTAPHRGTLFADLRAALNAAGINNAQIPAKLEGIAFGEDVVIDGVTKHTLYLAIDNDFLAVAPGGLPNPNRFFVFAFADADLGGSVYEAQRFKAPK